MGFPYCLDHTSILHLFLCLPLFLTSKRMGHWTRNLSIEIGLPLRLVAPILPGQKSVGCTDWYQLPVGLYSCHYCDFSWNQPDCSLSAVPLTGVDFASLVPQLLRRQTQPSVACQGEAWKLRTLMIIQNNKIKINPLINYFILSPPWINIALYQLIDYK